MNFQLFLILGKQIPISVLKAKIDQLPQAILVKAFRGELVEHEVKGYVVEESEGLMVAEDRIKFKTSEFSK